MLPVILLCILVVGQCNNGQSYKCRRTKRPGDWCTIPSGEEGICEPNGWGSNGRCAPLKCKVNEVDGGFTEWSEWSDTCNDISLIETQTRTRNCANPPPSNGGADCTGAADEIRFCPNILNEVDGDFTEWSEWSDTCNDISLVETQTRTRNCTNPPPSNGGADCTGAADEIRFCPNILNEVDGGFTEWSEWSDTCNDIRLEEIQTRTRNCTNPPPSNGGADCTGAADEIRFCPNILNEVDGGFTEWSEWSDTCNDIRLEEIQTRTRNCTNPPPSNGGADCTGAADEIRFCPNILNEVDGGFTEWSVWSDTCNDISLVETQTRTRNCTNPPPSNGGADCTGAADEIRFCPNICNMLSLSIRKNFFDLWSSEKAAPAVASDDIFLEGGSGDQKENTRGDDEDFDSLDMSGDWMTNQNINLIDDDEVSEEKEEIDDMVIKEDNSNKKMDDNDDEDLFDLYDGIGSGDNDDEDLFDLYDGIGSGDNDDEDLFDLYDGIGSGDNDDEDLFDLYDGIGSGDNGEEDLFDLYDGIGSGAEEEVIDDKDDEDLFDLYDGIGSGAEEEVIDDKDDEDLFDLYDGIGSGAEEEVIDDNDDEDLFDLYDGIGSGAEEEVIDDKDDEDLFDLYDGIGSGAEEEVIYDNDDEDLFDLHDGSGSGAEEEVIDDNDDEDLFDLYDGSGSGAEEEVINYYDNYDCLAILFSGKTVSGVYNISLGAIGEEIEVFCDMEKNGGGWTVFQNRYDGSVDFGENVHAYTVGFGEVDGEYWLGLYNIHALTWCPSQLYIHLVDHNNDVGYQKWNTFRVGDEQSGFVLNVDELLGNTAGDDGRDIRYNDGARFSAYDIDYDTYDDGNCADEDDGGWWYKGCTFAGVNGLYPNSGEPGYFYYQSFRGDESLKESRLMVRRRPF